MKKNAVRTAFLDTVPVLTGYVFLGFGFGILLLQQGYGVGWAAAMSTFIYAGSMQYVTVSLLSGGAGLVTAAFTTLLVNARHLFYGISMVDAYKGSGYKKPYLIFALTDETYSLVSRNQAPEGLSRHGYCFLVSLFKSYLLGHRFCSGLAGRFSDPPQLRRHRICPDCTVCNHFCGAMAQHRSSRPRPDRCV